LPSADELPLDLAGVLPPQAESLGGSGAEGLLDVGQLDGFPGDRRDLGGRGRTEVFGLVGEGTKFVYVFDRSGSMDGFGGRPLAAAKQELIASLRDWEEIHQFQIIFYNERPRVFNPTGGTPRLAWGDPPSKEQAERFVRGITADGATRHMDALRMALNLQPDVIFFLTDADEPQLAPAELARIRQRNRGTAIHAIEFGFGPRRSQESFLVRLARENGGRHVYVDISKLRPDG
jgi:hypothetical protein